jgi:hypothetical protein
VINLLLEEGFAKRDEV